MSAILVIHINNDFIEEDVYFSVEITVTIYEQSENFKVVINIVYNCMLYVQLVEDQQSVVTKSFTISLEVTEILCVNIVNTPYRHMVASKLIEEHVNLSKIGYITNIYMTNLSEQVMNFTL